jgi:predicted transposase YdaD
MYDNTCKYLAENFPEDISSWLIEDLLDFTSTAVRVASAVAEDGAQASLI